MNRRLLNVGLGVVLVVAWTAVVSVQLHAAIPDATAAGAAGLTTQPAALDEATRKKIEQKANKLVEAIQLNDADKSAKVKAMVSEWLAIMLDWHRAHDAELGPLWSQWNAARAVVPKDEFPGEVIAHQIDAVYASLKPAYDVYVKRLSEQLAQEQVDAIKEHWSRSPGMTRTYNAYLQIVPDLTEKDKQVIRDRMLMAREAAMLTDSDREIVAIYKRHKVKVEQYVGTLEWAKLHKAFAERGKANAQKEKTGEPKGDAAPAR
jgi:hypothetical protein